MDRDQAIKAINGNFLFEVTGTGQDGKPTTQFFRVDMRKEGKLIKGKGSGKPKPDVTIRVADKDLVALSTGKANPQSYFLKGEQQTCHAVLERKRAHVAGILLLRTTQGQGQHHAGLEDEWHSAERGCQIEQALKVDCKHWCY